MTRTTPTLASITFDCSDALTVARFWSTVLDREVPDTTSDHVQLAGEPTWSFRSRPEPKAAKNGVHLDLGVANVTKAVDRLVALGATAWATSTSRATDGRRSPTPRATSSTLSPQHLHRHDDRPP